MHSVLVVSPTGVPLGILSKISGRENNYPNIPPIEWFLLTTIPIGSLEEAVQKIEAYRERWKIERFHYILKSGCGIEDLQLETKERLEILILTKLGGFLVRKHDGKPGVKVLWRVLQKLNEGLLFVGYFRSIQSSSQDMGNE
ncbi:MAG TPA: hypothetical protein DDW50_15195 [Firmicutes bacterium]|jgi:hypothetical protein|nr:hypothetical protein [Bacillota bacterium]